LRAVVAQAVSLTYEQTPPEDRVQAFKDLDKARGDLEEAAVPTRVGTCASPKASTAGTNRVCPRV
jgi:hypothetical protein